VEENNMLKATPYPDGMKSICSSFNKEYLLNLLNVSMVIIVVGEKNNNDV